jgi:hypothetical protein
MLRSVYDFRRFTIAATEGNLGRVGDLYFDDRDWAVRYLAVDADDWLPGHRVFVSPMSLRSTIELWRARPSGKREAPRTRGRWPRASGRTMTPKAARWL